VKNDSFLDGFAISPKANAHSSWALFEQAIDGSLGQLTGPDFTNTATKCWSGLAREGGVSVRTSDTEPPLSRASPLPHL